MSDHDQPARGERPPGDPAFGDPSFDDPAFDDLRALLADTRVTEPVPADVAARLDDTLGSLQERRSRTPRQASVVVLRRRVGRALVAAAAVAVVGAGSVGILRSGGGDAGNDSATTSADAGRESAPERLQEQDDADAGSAKGYAGAAAALSLTTAHFARDAAAAMRTLAVTDAAVEAGTPAPTAPTPVQTPAPGSTESRALKDQQQAPPVTATPQSVADSLDTVSGASCAGPAAPDAVVLAATLDGVPVALVFRPPTDSVQRVEAWSCDGASLLASASVPH